MQTGWNKNQAVLRGRLDGTPTFSHATHDIRYYGFPLLVSRLSGAADRLNVIVAQQVLERRPVAPGDYLEVLGEVRSFNNRTGPGSRLVITLLARDIQSAQPDPANHLLLAGVLCKAPVLRRTPLGRDICDLMLAVNRKYGRADYLPCITWGGLARQCGRLHIGDCVSLEGRLQSRAYQKVVDNDIEERTAYEISVMQLELLKPDGISV